MTQFLFLLHFEQKKRHIPKKCPFLRLPQRNKSTLDRNVPCYLHGHTDSKNGFIYVFFEVVVQEWTFTISLPNFLFSDLYFCLYLYYFSGNATRTPLTIIYHAVQWNARNKIKKRVVLSKMPLGKGSAAMGFQIGFKGVGFFFVFKGYCVFDTPRFVFWCVRNIAFIMFFQAGSQIFGTADVEMGSGCFINENVNVMKIGHKRKSFRITFEVELCRIARLPSSCFTLRCAKSAIIQITVEWYHRNIARLHLLCRLRRGSLPLRVRSSAPMACQGEISALPRWRLVGDEGKPEIFKLRLKLALTPWFYTDKWLWRLNLPFNKNHL